MEPALIILIARVVILLLIAGMGAIRKGVKETTGRQPARQDRSFSNKAKGGTMFSRIFGRKIRDTGALFMGHFVEVKALYAVRFDAVPCVSFIGELDVTKAFAFISETYQSEIRAVYQHAYFDHTEQRMFFNNTVFVLTDSRIVELGNNYAQVLHTNSQYGWAKACVESLAPFRLVEEKAAEERVIGFAYSSTGN